MLACLPTACIKPSNHQTICPPACLSVHGHDRGNRAPCAARPVCTTPRPLGVREYSLGARYRASRLGRLQSARLRPRSCPHMASLVEFVASRSALDASGRSRSRSTSRRSRAIRRRLRRDALSPDYRLRASRSHSTTTPANRVSPSRSTRNARPRPAPHVPPVSSVW